jgi:glycosyl-4,4'-diaponeurosporenoate acyltransferase
VLIELPIAWIIALNVIAWMTIQLGLAWALTQPAAERFDARNFFARPKRWERDGRFYEKIFAIKSWKDRLPDAASWFRGGFPKANLRTATPDFLARFLCETWRGELVHWLALLAVPLFYVWNPWWAVLVNAAYAVAANLPCILVQRYNRARFQRLLATQTNREISCRGRTNRSARSPTGL